MISDKNFAIRLTDVDVCFYVRETGAVSLKEVLFSLGKRPFLDKKFVLCNINLEIKHGESIALLGKNGSGKSTLLRVLSGIIEPEKGKIEVNGVVAPLLSLGVG